VKLNRYAPWVLAFLFVLAGWFSWHLQVGEDRKDEFVADAMKHFTAQIGTDYIESIECSEETLAARVIQRQEVANERSAARSLAMSFSKFRQENLGSQTVTVILAYEDKPIWHAYGRDGICSLVAEGPPK